MSEKKVETFESNANQRGVGQINLRELVAMKQQLKTLEAGLHNSSGAPAVQTSSMYPVLPPIEPTPGNAIEDINEIIKMIASIIQQIADSIGLAKLMGAKSAEPEVVAECRPATFSKVLPGTAPKPLPKPIVVPPPVVAPIKEANEIKVEPKPVKPPKAESIKTEPVKVEPVISPPTEEQLKAAHAFLDSIAKLGFQVEAPTELIVGTKDELYCIQHFRKMLKEQQERIAENFRQRFDKLCK